MISVRELLSYFHTLITVLIQSVSITVFAYILMDWIVTVVRPRRICVFMKIYSFLNENIEPVFAYCRQFIPPIMGIDFSGILVFMALEGTYYLLNFLITLLQSLV